MRPLFIIGTSGLTMEVAQLADTLRCANRVREEIADSSQDKAKIRRSLPFGVVAGTDELLLEVAKSIDVVIGIGLAAAKSRVAHSLKQNLHICFPNLIHPNALIDQNWVRLGVGNVVAAGCVFTCDVKIGDSNLFNFDGAVGHDARIGYCNFFNPLCNLSGNTLIDDQYLVRTGSQVLEKIWLISGCELGAGGVLTTSCDVEGIVLTGVPTKSWV